LMNMLWALGGDMSCGIPFLYLSTGWLARLDSYAT